LRTPQIDITARFSSQWVKGFVGRDPFRIDRSELALGVAATSVAATLTALLLLVPPDS
jgi:hypothetical protein